MNKYETKMDKITTEFAEHICDNLCRYPHMADGKSLEIICSECKIGKFICDILNEYNRINDFDKTQTAKLLKQVQELKERDTAKKPNEVLKICERGVGGVKRWTTWKTL